MLGGARRGLERAGTVAGVLQYFRSLVRPFDAATLRSEGRRVLLRFTRSSDDRWRSISLAGATRRPEVCAGEDDRSGEQERSRRAGNLLLRGGEAAGEEKGARGRNFYLGPRLRCPPDVGGFRGRRWGPSGRCGRCPLLTRAGVTSERSSGASQMIRHELCRPERDSAGRGFRVAAGGRGECLLLLRLDGAFREIAGGPGNGSGLLDWVSGECGEDLELG